MDVCDGRANTIYGNGNPTDGLSEASVERLRKFLLPLELAEAELKAKPAAAVVVLLRDGARNLEVLLGERSKREGDPWSGQVGLPGGRRREGDGTMLATAVRETREEVGIDLEGQADILGHMAPRAPGNKPEILVVPYVAVARGRIEATSGPEMASVFWAPLSDLPPTHARRVVATILGDLSVPSFTYDGRLIWGFTYRILEELLVLVGLSA
jgi:8-oxo-dGTP pyrophosphatase MutT (NUDIX family)